MTAAGLHQAALAQLGQLAAKADAASAGPWRVEADGAPPQYAGGDIQDGWATVSLIRGEGDWAEIVEVAALYWESAQGAADVEEAVSNAEFLVAARAAMPALAQFAIYILELHGPDTPPASGARFKVPRDIFPATCRGCYQTWPCREARPVLILLRQLNMLPADTTTTEEENP
jgi:hypothetical protein